MAPDVAQAVELVATLRARGVWIERRGPDRLRVGPPELLDDETMERMRAWKPTLLALLAEPRTWPCVRCSRFAFQLPTLCFWCRRAAETTRHA